MNSKNFAAVKGMNDLLPPSIESWQFIEKAAREIFGNYGYQEIRTPILEDTALFVRSVGEGTDIVGKEMYTFTDRGDRSLTLRPEGTAPAARAYIENNITNKEPVTRWFYMGPMFRYERMKTGRYRQFYQIGAEAYGALDPAQDVETIALVDVFLKRIGVPDVMLRLNSLGEQSTRPAYLQALRDYFAPQAASLSPEAAATLERNPMRLLDSKEPALQPLIAGAPAIVDFIDEASKAHFAEVQRLLTKLGIAFVLDRTLVRGLDYYSRTTFEFVYQPATGENALGTAGTVCGGGRYDGLVKDLGGPEKPAVGFAMGLDRLVLLVEAAGARKPSRPTLFIGTFDGPMRDEAFVLVTKLRNAGYAVDFDPRGGKMKRQIERAIKVGARFFGAYGDAEHTSGKLGLKNLDLPDATDNKVEVAVDALPTWLRETAASG